jgi:hypothetical protein
MLAALNQVLQALAAGRIKRAVAATLLSGIKLADRLLTDIDEAGETISPANGYLQPTRNEPAVRPQTGNSGASGAQTVARIAASQAPANRAPASKALQEPADSFVEKMMAQAHQRLAGNPGPDPRFLSV